MCYKFFILLLFLKKLNEVAGKKIEFFLLFPLQKKKKCPQKEKKINVPYFSF